MMILMEQPDRPTAPEQGDEKMNREQTAFLQNLTAERAARLLRKFDHDPAVALIVGEDAYAAFCRCWETVYPGEYIQRVRRSGGTHFYFQEV
tara:strand:+ start:539 stop:814 length:276 start_codon:yes stop_codon:yes gene_type:complete